MKKTVISGIQTSGNLHIGNYLGSIQNWLQMQDSYNCFFFLADLHSLTSSIAPNQLKKSSLEILAIYLASGLDPKKSVIFAQSSVKEHCELAWIFNCITPLGWLKRMTQFKDKAKNQDKSNTGLLTYPLLMAADILLYHAHLVPVGDDQKQHLEITRDIAAAFNRKYEQELFTLPEPLIQGVATRVMSLRDGRKKMSKSDDSDYSRINLLDDPDLIVQKMKKAKTDSISEFSYDSENRPELANLINIFSAFTNQNKEQIIADYQDKGFGKFKLDVADAIINILSPMQNEYNKLMQDQTYLLQLLDEGKKSAQAVAAKTCTSVKEIIGIKYI